MKCIGIHLLFLVIFDLSNPMADPLKDYFYFGKVLRTHGYKGALKVKLDVDDTTSYQTLESIFLEVKNSLVPYFIEFIHFEKNKANLKLRDINTIDQAQKLIDCALYLPLSVLPKLKGSKFYFHEVADYKVMDLKFGFIGTVDEVLDLPGNALLQVKQGNKEILIPLADDIILKIDRRKKQIDIQAPEGLIDMYLK